MATKLDEITRGNDGVVTSEVTPEFHVTFDDGDGVNPGIMRIEGRCPYTSPYEATQWIDACRRALVDELLKRGAFW